jgi:hypothetical protein
MSKAALRALASALSNIDDDEEDDDISQLSNAERVSKLRSRFAEYIANTQRQWKVGDLVTVAKESGYKDNWGVGIVIEIDPNRRRTGDGGSHLEHQPCSVRVMFYLKTTNNKDKGFAGFWYDAGDLRPYVDRTTQ